jgi:hypothetical protein
LHFVHFSLFSDDRVTVVAGSAAKDRGSTEAETSWSWVKGLEPSISPETSRRLCPLS